MGEVSANQHSPVHTLTLRHRGIPVTGQVDQTVVFGALEEVNRLRPARRFADVCEALAGSDRVYRARLACIRASRECHLTTDIGRQVARIVCRSNETGSDEGRHRSLLWRPKVALRKSVT